MQPEYTLPYHANFKAGYKTQLDEENCIGAPPLSHKHTNAHFGAFAQFPLYIHEKGRGRERDDAKLRETFCPLTNKMCSKQNRIEQIVPSIT